MSDQLTLEGFGGAQANKTSDKKNKTTKPVAAKAGATRTTVGDALDERLQRLTEQKKQIDAQLATQKIPETLLRKEQAAVDQPVQKSQQVQSVSTEVATPQQPKAEDEEKKTPAEPTVLTVADLNRGIKNILEKNYAMVWVKGEISNFKIPASGHMYFTLKDDKAQVRAVMFKGFAQGIKFKPADGHEVLVRCRVTVYEPRGDYQLFCEVMEPVGYGALQVAFEKLKAQLQSEGLFDQARKRPLPAFPTRIAIITSPTGAAIRDMLNILSRRFGGGLDISIIPTSVQGDKAPGEIVKALEFVNKLGPDRFDVLIVGRGGGSLEDLWAFNTESVVRAVAASRIPTISAVGHEVDFTICDFVADLRAPTPSAAAELVVKNKADLSDRVRSLNRQLQQLIIRKIQFLRTKQQGVSKGLIDPKKRLQDLMLRCDEWSERLSLAMKRLLQDLAVHLRLLQERMGTPAGRLELAMERVSGATQRLESATARRLEVDRARLSEKMTLLNGLSPLRVLDRGYSIVKKEGQIIKNANQVKPGDRVQIRLSEGELSSQII